MVTITPDLLHLYADADATTLARHVKTGDVSALELVETGISLIEQIDPILNSVVVRSFDMAREMAKNTSLDRMFAGVPFLLKNLASFWKGIPLTSGLAYRKDYIPGEDSAFAAKMREAGLIPLGRTNVPENAWALTTEPRLYGPTISPWNPAVTPGGSSGGAGAAVAAGLVPLAEASDAAGSIRVPASCCGLVGLKPSRGRITFGPAAVDLLFGSIYTFALTKTVRDSAAFLDVTAGNLPGDPYLPGRPAGSWSEGLAIASGPLRIGYTVKAPWGAPLAPEIETAMAGTVDILQQLGHRLEPYDMTTDLEEAWYYYNQLVAVFQAQEVDLFAAHIGQPLAERDVTPVIWSQVQRGRSLSGLDVMTALDRVRAAGRDITRELMPYDAYLTPTLTQLPRPLGYWDMNNPDLDVYNHGWSDAAYMAAFNYSGLPAISVPAVWTEDDIPVGVQFVGRYADEMTLLRLAASLEQSRPWRSRRPKVSA